MKTLSALLALLCATPAAASWQCPASLPTPTAGFDMVGPTPKNAVPLDTMLLFDGPPGEETQRFAAQLAPDSTVKRPGGFTQAWTFAGNEQLLLICSYSGVPAYYRAKLRPLPKACTLRKDPGRTVAHCE
jgi:hypothetical protein